MRIRWLPVAFAAKSALASPVSGGVEVQPNQINILGGDFGLVNNAVTIEMWNSLSTTVASLSSGTAKGAGNGVVASLNGLGRQFENIASSIGNELFGWLGEQLMMWFVGTDNSDPTEIICSMWDYPVVLSSWLYYVGPPARKGDKCGLDHSGGTGPYKANYTTDPSLPLRTIYAPKSPPKNISMPILAWTGCIAGGTLFPNLLTEIASYGYLVVTTGPANGVLSSTLVSDTTRNINWATSNPAAKKYGNIDTSRVVVAGHSCGGLEALSASYKDPRVKLTMLFDSGIVDAPKRTKLNELKAPVAYFVGGTEDMAYDAARTDYSQWPSNVPVLLASLGDVGHFGTMFVEHAGRMGKAAVDYLEWKLRDDKAKARLFCKPSTGSQEGNVTVTKAWSSPLEQDGWTIKTKSGMC